MTSEIIESAKATQEVAKTASNAIDAGREMGKFASGFIRYPLEQLSGIIGDKLYFVRKERQVRLQKRFNELLEQQALTAPNKSIPLKNALPLLEHATIEEDDYLQDMWVRLLVNGTNESTGINIERSFIEILSQISYLEAKILETIYSLPFEEKSTHKEIIITEFLPDSASFSFVESESDLNNPSQEVMLSLANLDRIGCINLSKSFGGSEIFKTIHPTLIGKEFIAACTFKDK